VAKSSSVGITFSMPVITQWMRGTVVTMSALPSLVTVSVVPVSAMMKLAPEMPMSALRKCSRSAWRASRVSAGISVSRGRPWATWKSSATSSRDLCTAGATMWEGGSLASCRMYSPRSVSITFTPASAKRSLRFTSSETMDLDFVTSFTPLARAISSRMSHAASALSAQWTTAPRRVALRSNSTR